MPPIKPNGYLDEVKNLREWSDRAACPEHDPAMFDTTVDRKGTVLDKNVDKAREICVGCPVMMDCLIHAVVYDITTGVWGGLVSEERDEWALREHLRAA